MRLGYGTNGFGDHRLDQALVVLADLGYDGVALTLDARHLDPFAPDIGRQVERLAKRLGELGLGVVVETGGRYVLDPFRKHYPTLLHPPGEAAPRVGLLRQAVRIGADLGAEAVSFWSGVRPPGVSEAQAWDNLVAGVGTVVEEAAAREVTLGFEPEPGMLVDTIEAFEHLRELTGRPRRLGLTLDVGHCRCLESDPVPDSVRRAAPYLVNVQIEDMRRGVHEHLEFGDGEIDFPPVLAALDETGYRGLVSVELPRHSHAAPVIASRSLRFLREAHRRGGADGAAPASPVPSPRAGTPGPAPGRPPTAVTPDRRARAGEAR
ncbi:sugar phosphate isomerase/epimerase [Sphaerisporangium sp. TRM90804]|uniref:sugar phosphate isomerase/epimerase family protein n=1 Tax=Sphaerisporangium sp. TRM90804 TaxID=3031113 RepID=UPI002446DFE1|nr:sugar phosphate isomerase/epimerase [Sphaerisporangium sp. TRM90804]MDH2426319.1 sugar phosphate isomerase/epimerase [Sphaerisporangium sp. TRM90804]